MLILVLLLGVVHCSPLPLSSDRALPEQTKNEDQSQSASNLSSLDKSDPPPPLFHSPSSPPPPFFHSPSTPLYDLQQEDSWGAQVPDVRAAAQNWPSSRGSLPPQTVKIQGDGGEGVRQKDVNSYSESEVSNSAVGVSVAQKAPFEIDRVPRNSLLPPLVIAQQPSDLAIEPTEVEAPGTTPTTIAMVTDPSIVAYDSSLKLPISKPVESADPVKRDTNIYRRGFIGNSSDQTSLKLDDKSQTIAAKRDDISSLDSVIAKDSLASIDDLPQKDDPLSGSTQDKSNHSQIKNEFKIKTYNKTYTLVHEKVNPNQKKNIDSNSSDRKVEEAKIFRVTNPLRLLSEQKGEHFEADSNPSSVVADFNTEALKASEERQRESKRIITTIHHLNISNHSNFQSPKAVIKDEVQRNHQSGLVRNKLAYLKEEGKLAIVLDRENSDSLDFTTLVPEMMNVTTETIDKYFVAEKMIGNGESRLINDESYNQETREMETDSFFSSLDSQVDGKKVKKDGTGAFEHSRVPGSHLDVITSSSEVSYKQFDPAKNMSQLDSRYGTSKSEANDTKLTLSDSWSTNGGTGREEAHKLSSNSTRPLDDLANISPETVFDKEQSDHVVSLSDEANVTSLPSQTSVVEPIRANSSSSLSEVTLPSSPNRGPSSHPTKSDSAPIVSDVIPPHTLGAYPDAPFLKKGSEAPPLQQERVSIPVSEHVDRPISPGGVVAIVGGVLILMILVGGAAAYFVYQRLEGFRPKILTSDRSCANSDSGGYLDDQCRVAYVNSQIDLPKTTPEDLVSLDNDSFLNSLESMTIQNLWTDSIRHTKL